MGEIFGEIFLIRYVGNDNKARLALYHSGMDAVYVYNEDLYDSHDIINTNQFTSKYHILEIYRCNHGMPFMINILNCIAAESLENKDYYDILMGSFLNADYEKYPLEDLIKNGHNKWFDKIYGDKEYNDNFYPGLS